MVALHLIDQVDLAIIAIFLADDDDGAPTTKLLDCLVSLDASAKHLALAHKSP